MLRFLLPLALIAVIGCGGDESGLIPVTGTVKYADGSNIAFENGTVIFTPTAAGKPANGAVDKDGSFAMTTTNPGDGVQAGQYKVVLQLWKSYRDQSLAIPAKYGEPATTPLEATVDDDHTHFEFVVEK